MANNESVKIETLTLDDGRRAERHSVVEDNGNEVIEVFAEERRPLKLEKRIVREHKTVVAKETHETVRDGEVVQREVVSRDAEPPMQIRERIGIADHAKVIDGDYVRKDEIDKLVADGVVAGVSVLMEHMGSPAVHEEAPAPIFNAQSVVEKNVAEKKSKDGIVNIVMAGILIAQMAFFGYMFFVM